MSFPDLDEVTKRPQRKPHWTKRWLREIFVEDLGLKILALVIAIALWYGVTGQRTPTTIRVPRVPLNFRLPNNMEISNDPRMDVEVTLTGNKRDLDTINVRDLTVNVDVSDLKPRNEPYNVQLTPERISMGLPDGVRYGDIQPNNVTLKLEPRIERELEVEVQRSGNVPAGYDIRITPVPGRVKVRGPESHVKDLQKAQTENISLDGRTESFTLPQVAIIVTDKKVDLIDSVVSVRVEIEERRVEKTYPNVVVQLMPGMPVGPVAASVKVYGPPSLLDKLRPGDLQLALEQDENGELKPRLIVPAEMEGRIEIRSYKLQQ
ncbi:MAG TPA: CdaR family protein [Pyrinomonadaceae bacterium]